MLFRSYLFARTVPRLSLGDSQATVPKHLGPLGSLGPFFSLHPRFPRVVEAASAPRREQGLRHGQVVRCGLCSVAGHTHTPAHAGTSNAALALRLRCSTMLVRARGATLPTRTLLEGVG